jgi:hypothetical protein
VLSLRFGADNGALTAGGGVRLADLGWGHTGLRLDYAAMQDRIAGWDHWLTLALVF